MMTVIVILISAVIVWIVLDFTYGRRAQRRQVTKKQEPLRQGDLVFYSEGRDLFEDLHEDIEKATHHIHMNFFILRDDTIGRDTLERLMRKAREGVEVRLLLDWLGSRGFPKKTKKQLEEAGVRFAMSRKPSFPYWFYSFNHRNHRKITVIDGDRGYMGGYNVGDEYLGKNSELGDWRDYHLKISGDGTQDLQRQFIADWREATGEEVKGAAYEPELREGDVTFRLFPTDGAFLEKRFLNMIRNAETSIIIGSAYYIPGRKIQHALLSALERGVSVKLLLPMKKDHPLVHEAAVPHFAPLIQAGCEIFLFYQGFYHAKVLLIDEQVCDIGTANLDRRSLIFNNEINCFIYDDEVITTVLSALDRDFRRSEKLTLQSLKKRSIADRLKEGTATVLSPLL